MSMNANRGARIAGLVLHALIGGLMIFAGSGKAFGFAPDQIVRTLTEAGLGGRIALIGIGELVSGALLVVPRTLSVGVLLVSGFWGGAICLHMSEGTSYVFQSALLALTWAGAWLRCPALLASFRAGRPGVSRAAAGAPTDPRGSPSA